MHSRISSTWSHRSREAYQARTSSGTHADIHRAAPASLMSGFAAFLSDSEDESLHGEAELAETPWWDDAGLPPPEWPAVTEPLQLGELPEPGQVPDWLLAEAVDPATFFPPPGLEEPQRHDSGALPDLLPMPIQTNTSQSSSSAAAASWQAAPALQLPSLYVWWHQPLPPGLVDPHHMGVVAEPVEVWGWRVAEATPQLTTQRERDMLAVTAVEAQRRWRLAEAERVLREQQQQQRRQSRKAAAKARARIYGHGR